jgi:surface carbohydrate biosynthesis protein
MNKAFGFVLDHPRRDMPGAITFAHAAARRGCDTYIVPMYDQATDVPLLPLDALVVNFARPANLDLVKGYAEAGLPVFVLDTEGGILTEAGTNTPDRLGSLLKERGFDQLLAGHFFWGSRLRNAFADRSGLPEDRLIVSGCPRFDYASPRWRRALTHPRRDFVLMNASYPLVNPLFVSDAASERAAAVSAGWDADYITQLTRDVAQAFEEFKAVTARLAADLPKLTFLVRPHPFENHQTYQREFAGLSNVVVDGAGSVLNVIANSSCLVHLNCSTAVEAVMLDRLPISLEYLNTPRMLGHAPLPSRISQHARSYEELKEMVSRPQEYATHFPFAERHREFIHPWFHENDGGAAERVVEALIGLTGKRLSAVSVSRSLTASRQSPRMIQRAQSMTANLFGSLLTSRVRAATKAVRREKFFSAIQIASALTELQRVDGSPSTRVMHARHPWTGVPLASVAIRASRR